MASEGPSSRGTRYAGNHKATVKDRNKEMGKRLPSKMLGELEVEKDDL